MCGFSGNVETFRAPLRHNVGALDTGRRMVRADRANVLVNILAQGVEALYT